MSNEGNYWVTSLIPFTSYKTSFCIYIKNCPFIILWFPYLIDKRQNNDGDYGIQTETVANEWEFLRNFMTLNEKERILIGHDFDSFIKGCTFRGKDCTDEE